MTPHDKKFEYQLKDQLRYQPTPEGAMRLKVKIEASLACANFRNFERDVRQLDEAKVDYFHFDMMDGRFVPNFALDFTLLRTIRELSETALVCHLMIEEPERYIDRVASFAPAFISIHSEATHNVQRALQQIRRNGVKAGIALNPATPTSALSYIFDDVDLITVMTVNPGFAGQALVPATIRKLSEIRQSLDREGYSQIELEVDGNVSFENIPTMLASGATMLVGGTSSVFSPHHQIGEAVARIQDLVEHRLAQ